MGLGQAVEILEVAFPGKVDLFFGPNTCKLSYTKLNPCFLLGRLDFGDEEHVICGGWAVFREGLGLLVAVAWRGG